uniref:Autophagy-related protein 2 n=1 Tax=Lygus hesperus TaxID=30085 RepID=A0A0A9WGP5_LYGHE
MYRIPLEAHYFLDPQPNMIKPALQQETGGRVEGIHHKSFSIQDKKEEGSSFSPNYLPATSSAKVVGCQKVITQPWISSVAVLSTLLSQERDVEWLVITNRVHWSFSGQITRDNSQMHQPQTYVR